MKKILLSMAFALVAILAHAQEVQMDFIPFHYSGYDIPQFENKLLQQRNGDLVANVLMMSPSGDNNIPQLLQVFVFIRCLPPLCKSPILCLWPTPLLRHGTCSLKTHVVRATFVSTSNQTATVAPHCESRTSLTMISTPTLTMTWWLTFATQSPSIISIAI